MDGTHMETRKLAFYPGCSLEGTSSGFAASMQLVLDKLNVQAPELEDWNCCGATSAHAMDHDLYLELNLRNLSLAQNSGYTEILAPCAACYHRMASANFDFSKDKEVLEKLNQKTGLDYKGDIKIRNILDLLANVIGTRKIAGQVTNPLKGLKAACYYGCLNTRIPRMEPFDSIDYPMSMDNITECLGAKPINWSYKTECCGASLFLSVESVSAKLVAKILKDALVREADCIVVACPMCQTNLDTKQEKIREKFGISKPIPVIFITQLMGLAFGMDETALGLNQNFVPFETKHQTA